jgi:hypothetical protein
MIRIIIQNAEKERKQFILESSPYENPADIIGDMLKTEDGQEWAVIAASKVRGPETLIRKRKVKSK